MGLLTERYYPVVLGLIGPAAYLLFFRDDTLPLTLPSLFTAAISLASIGVGFFAVAKTTVVQLEDKRPLIKKLRQADRYDTFLDYMSWSIHLSFLLAVLSAGALLLDFTTLHWFDRVAFSLWLYVGIVAGLSYFRVVRVLNVVLDSKLETY